MITQAVFKKLYLPLLIPHGDKKRKHSNKNNDYQVNIDDHSRIE